MVILGWFTLPQSTRLGVEVQEVRLSALQISKTASRLVASTPSLVSDYFVVFVADAGL